MTVDAVAKDEVVAELAQVNRGATGIRELHSDKIGQRLTQICRLFHDLPDKAQRPVIIF